jgi:hypothetical protein
MGVHEPSDGMAEEVERQIQLAISVAALAARRLINSRQAALAAAAAQSEERAGQLRAQFERERSVASFYIQPVFDDAWWEAAQPRDVGEMWERAEQWRHRDGREPEGTVFDRAAERIEQETRERWRLDAGAVAALAHADNVAEHDRLAALDAAQETVEDGVEVAVPAAGGRYDSRERRDRLQARLGAADVPREAVDAQVLTDTAQARPAIEAVRPDGPQIREPGRSRARSAVRERHRAR